MRLTLVICSIAAFVMLAIIGLLEWRIAEHKPLTGYEPSKDKQYMSAGSYLESLG